MTTEVTTIKHKDIKGRELLYIMISRGNKTAYINVGEKTLKSVDEVLANIEEVKIIKEDVKK